MPRGRPVKLMPCGWCGEPYAVSRMSAHAAICPMRPPPPVERIPKPKPVPRVDRRPEAIALRAEGLSLRKIGERMGITGQRVCQLLSTADAAAALCPKCKRPSDRMRSSKGRVPQCSECHAAMMAARPSKIARRTGYRTSRRAHERVWIVRWAKQGMTIREIADRLGVNYISCWLRIKRMRADGIDVPVASGNSRRKFSPRPTRKRTPPC